MSIPELIEAAKRRDGITDDDIGLILGRKGSMVSRYRTGKIPLPVSLYEKAAKWIGVDVDTIRGAAALDREAEAQAQVAAAEALVSAGKQTEKNLRLAMQLVEKLSQLAPDPPPTRRKPTSNSPQHQPAR